MTPARLQFLAAMKMRLRGDLNEALFLGFKELEFRDHIGKLVSELALERARFSEIKCNVRLPHIGEGAH